MLKVLYYIIASVMLHPLLAVVSYFVGTLTSYFNQQIYSPSIALYESKKYLLELILYDWLDSLLISFGALFILLALPLLKISLNFREDIKWILISYIIVIFFNLFIQAWILLSIHIITLTLIWVFYYLYRKALYSYLRK